MSLDERIFNSEIFLICSKIKDINKKNKIKSIEILLNEKDNFKEIEINIYYNNESFNKVVRIKYENKNFIDDFKKKFEYYTEKLGMKLNLIKEEERKLIYSP
ncbi:MAG: hypothetical protein QXM27_00300 [Candidatus Pacearchaeota archaeon]